MGNYCGWKKGNCEEIDRLNDEIKRLKSSKKQPLPTIKEIFDNAIKQRDRKKSLKELK